jgi:hypothetical protein
MGLRIGLRADLWCYLHYFSSRSRSRGSWGPSLAPGAENRPKTRARIYHFILYKVCPAGVPRPKRGRSYRLAADDLRLRPKRGRTSADRVPRPMPPARAKRIRSYTLAWSKILKIGLEVDHVGGLGGPGGPGDPFAIISGAPGAAQTPNMTVFRPFNNLKFPPKVQPRWGQAWPESEGKSTRSGPIDLGLRGPMPQARAKGINTNIPVLWVLRPLCHSGVVSDNF